MGKMNGVFHGEGGRVRVFIMDTVSHSSIHSINRFSMHALPFLFSKR